MDEYRRFCESNKVDKCHVAFTALRTTHVSSIKTSFRRKLLL